MNRSVTSLILSLFLVFYSSCKKEDLTQGTPKYTLDFTYSFQAPSGNHAPATVQFTCTSTSAVDYFWDFGDNTNSYSSSPSHTYNSQGTYEVRLVAGFPDGGSLAVTKTLIVDAPLPLVASFSTNADTCLIGQTVQFTNSSLGATAYFWDFDNGFTSTATNPVVTFTSSGNYTVTLTAYNSVNQQSDSYSINIVVLNVVFPNLTQISISQLNNQYQGTSLQLGYGSKISGTVISDRSSSNISSTRNLVLWDGITGILVRSQSPHAFNLGDKVVIDINNSFLINYFGNLELDSVPLNNIQGDGIGQNYPPMTKTIGQILGQSAPLISTLVRINNVQITGSGSTFSGSVSINDGTGIINLFTRSYATFANTTYPTSTVSLTGILTMYNGQPQLEIRNLNDIQ